MTEGYDHLRLTQGRAVFKEAQHRCTEARVSLINVLQTVPWSTIALCSEVLRQSPFSGCFMRASCGPCSTGACVLSTWNFVLVPTLRFPFGPRSLVNRLLLPSPKNASPLRTGSPPAGTPGESGRFFRVLVRVVPQFLRTEEGARVLERPATYISLPRPSLKEEMFSVLELAMSGPSDEPLSLDSDTPTW